MSRSRSRSPQSSGPPRDRPHTRYSDDYRPKKRERSRSRDRGPPRKRRSTSPAGRPGRRRSESPVQDVKSHQRRDPDKHRQRDGDRDRPRERGQDRDRGNYRQPPRSRSRSHSPRRHSPAAFQRSKRPLPSQNDAFKGDDPDAPPAIEKEKPNYRPSGLLAAAANTVATHGGGNVVLKYHEPAEARKPPASQTWRLYVFKGDEILETLDLYTQSCWLFGREAAVCDCLVEHPSCSKQHAVIQFRYIEKRNEFGDKVGRVKPYVIDLESGNGTKVNDDALPPGRYFELRDKDVIKLGHSTREYVVQLPKS